MDENENNVFWLDLLCQFEELRSGDSYHVEALGELLLRWVRHIMSFMHFMEYLEQSGVALHHSTILHYLLV